MNRSPRMQHSRDIYACRWFSGFNPSYKRYLRSELSHSHSYRFYESGLYRVFYEKRRVAK